jgi:putative Mg2+ transporter-C (MgtC) family protein
VRGVTTAAVLWFITILGLAFGSGNLLLGTVGTCIAMFALFAMPHMEQRIKKDFYASVTVTLGLNGISDEDVKARITEAGVQVQRVDLDYDMQNQTRSLHCELKMRRSDVFALSRKIVAALVSSPGVTRVKWG